MKILKLHLRKLYFDQIQCGAKLLEYRLAETWKPKLEGKEFDEIHLFLGYPKKGDESRVIKRRWMGYEEITHTHPEFGPDPVNVLAINVGYKLEPKIMNYDPNMVFCGRMAIQTVKLVFGAWDSRAEMIVEVGGNGRGLSVIDCAVGTAFDKLPTDRFGTPCITMTDPDGHKSECSDEDGEGEDFLKEMLISAEIIDIQPENKNDSGREGE